MSNHLDFCKFGRTAEDFETKFKAAQSVLWMAKEYAEAGGSHGTEMATFKAALEIMELDEEDLTR